MKAIIIGAGRGARLMPMTEDIPKCFADVGGRRILDWAVDAFAANGIDDIVFIGGYRIDVVRAAYPAFRYCHNRDWERNNILVSLMHAEPEMDGPFICCYSDILFTPGVIERAAADASDISLVVDTDWRTRYVARTQHPTDDAEKVTVLNGLVTRVHREITDDDAHGEYIGVAKFSADGARRLRAHYHARREEHAGKPFREAPVFEKAYLIHLLQDMIEASVPVGHVDTHGGYMEIDTQQDYDLARSHWKAQ
ncbi:phosphocholine cytidylyltransferase family protein [Candidatus Poribacteria bacterium]|jgi:L-glutamine-phosphate cytidylyltransferase|nr:phosphocholine cytidylyltransferase family protein [Candidatus Poribacteria bacterium]MBT5533978.1 phosphocholine cytidylyltransferase family protein [Candidatus Poribacteria bacterium]MBT7097727.1 phosphocholine cytidylyltransferase family protein [Candidatus Poribacteria bacterium]MBT7808713.1 phosphocholine cytidylyltransferase family protein [Candidatus Poribacteria bacterium]